jgi:hypothetical protein
MEDETGQIVRQGLESAEGSERQSVMEKLNAVVTPAIAERLVAAYRETAQVESSWPTLTEMLHARLSNPDPYVRALALYALGERGAASPEVLDRLSADEHALVRETALHLKERGGRDAASEHSHLTTIEKMIALRSAPIFSRIAPEGLAELATASLEDEYAPGETLCVEGEPGNEVYILLAGEVRILKKDGSGEKFIGTEKAGGFIGEMAVLDPAPRSATLVAGETGTRALRLNGDAFRSALDRDPTIASSVMRTLAQRLRR